ncbi:MAG: sodium:proton antiporter [Planctomycetota bacterium]|nr:sodium:proton antiporter [Planctomycetota bacterium]
MSDLLLATTGHHGQVTETITIFIALLGGAAVVGVLTKFIRLPYTIALVLAGLLVAISGAAPPEAVITHDLVFVLFLPPLLFQAGLHLDLEHLQRKAAVVAVLAIPGVVLSMFGVALAIEPFLARGIASEASLWLPALLFGAMLAPTDPISVLATFRNVGAPEGLRTLVEAESLFNDGTGVALFLILLAAVFPQGAMADHDAAGALHEVQTAAVAPVDEANLAEEEAHDEAPAEAAMTKPGVGGGSISIAEAVLRFIRVAGLGLIMGLGLGLIALWLLKRLDDHVLENAITVVLAWGSYILSESVGGSGVIAVVVAGLIMGNYGHKLAMSERTSETINIFWESIDFIVNSIVFLLIGFELQDIGGLDALRRPHVLLAVGTVFFAILAVRAVIIYPAAFMYGRHWPGAWKHIAFWSGLKGSIPMALVLGLPAGELKTFLVPIAFGVVLVSLLLQGLTMPMLIRRLGVSGQA